MTTPERYSSSGTSARTQFLLWAALVGIAGLSATAVYQKAQKLTEERSDLSYQEWLKPAGESVTGTYLAGRYAASAGDYVAADRYLKTTLRQDPQNTEIAGYTYRLNLLNGNMTEAAKMARQLYAAQDQGSNPEIMVLLSLVKDKKYAEAREVLKNFEIQGFNLVVVPLLAGWIDLAEKKLSQPVQINQAIKQAAEFSPFIYYQTAIINDLAGFEEEALAQYTQALALSKTVPYRVVEMAANLYERRGEMQKAQELYARYKEQNPSGDMMFEAEKVKKDEKTVPERLIDNPQQGVAEILFSIASILHGENLNEEALIYIQEVLYIHPVFPAAQFMRGAILEDIGRLQDAFDAYKSLQPSNPYYDKALIRQAYLLNAMGDPERGLTLLGDNAHSKSQFYQAQLTRGDIYMRMKKYENAAAAYSKALEDKKSPASQPVPAVSGLWAVYYARGISYERLDKWELAEKDFKKALELEPNQPDVMNYLAYSWLTRNEHLEEAKEFLLKAVAARPVDGHIVDSMGWALYALRDYEGAIDYLERAIEIMPVDPTVNDHLGDAYWRIGRKNEARFQWKRALLFNPEKEQEAELNKKLQQGLPELDAIRDKSTANNEPMPLQRAQIQP